MINIYRTLPLTKSSFKPPLLRSHVTKLSNIIKRIYANQLDITLLEPLEGICKSPSYVYEPVDLVYLLKNNSGDDIITQSRHHSETVDDEKRNILLKFNILRNFSAYCQTVQPSLQNLKNTLEKLERMPQQ
ncbi:hypothetical protein NIES4075_73830 [Tolypothrix sp. NIES-4075]|uniref:hypothetical protein n=1 Tax=Tolypothrix sp. NIES-4075 TaxID=2005459 RepID=UPI000B5D029B|nr:hypothetical protein [Tolypothrix sp. NIES-4075]GAX46362.1 hypothetical protein NIES4075_73830 [Tolypothrix sp. NIES-4075]